MKASTNPLAYCEGGFLGGHLGIHDKIKPILKSATASFGITALNELQQLHNKKSLAEDGAFAVETLEYINKRVEEFKNEDGHLYRHLRYTYIYDNENRVTSKEASKWDSTQEAWVPYFKMNVSYVNNEVELSYARWNSKSNAYDSSIKKTIYEMNDDNVTLMLASTK